MKAKCESLENADVVKKKSTCVGILLCMKHYEFSITIQCHRNFLRALWGIPKRISERSEKSHIMRNILPRTLHIFYFQ